MCVCVFARGNRLEGLESSVSVFCLRATGFSRQRGRPEEEEDYRGGSILIFLLLFHFRSRALSFRPREIRGQIFGGHLELFSWDFPFCLVASWSGNSRRKFAGKKGKKAFSVSGLINNISFLPPSFRSNEYNACINQSSPRLSTNLLFVISVLRNPLANNNAFNRGLLFLL